MSGTPPLLPDPDNPGAERANRGRRERGKYLTSSEENCDENIRKLKVFSENNNVSSLLNN